MNNILRFFTLFALIGNVILSARAIDVAAWNVTNTKGQNYTAANGTIKTYARPDDYTLEDGSPRFNVLVNGEAYAGLYDTKNQWSGNVSFGYFDFKDGTPIDVVISCRKSLDDYDLIPAGAEISNVQKINDNILKFTISKANQNVTLVLGGDYRKGDVLHLFCNDMIDEPAATPASGYVYDSTTKTYCFGPGVYKLGDKFSNGELQVQGGRNIYLAGGAVVYGQLGISGANSMIYGHGMIVSTGGAELAAYGTTSGIVDGIICQRPSGIGGWQTTYTYCKNLTVKNIKILSAYFGSTDGMDFQLCQDMTFDNCFVRACDDCIAIKGLAADGTDPATQNVERNLNFTHMQLWTDANNAFGIGAETMASSFDGIRFTDSDVLSHDDITSYDGNMVDRSALNITALEGTYFHDIVIDDIRVNRCVQLIQLGFEDSFWYGTLLGNMSWEGSMYDIHFNNISCPNKTADALLANNVRLRGWYKEGTPTKYIHDIYFNNVTIEGQPFNSWDNANLVTNNTDDLKLVYDLHFNEEEVSGIEKIQTAQPLDNRYYDLAGRCVAQPTQGIYIHNGKKIILK